MDKLDQSRRLIKQFLQKYVDISARQKKDTVEEFVVFDEKHDKYFWITWGWQGKKYLKAVQVFVQIKDDKIWVQEDWTEEGIANFLVENGIPKHQIVLGFQHQKMREFTGFATA